MSPVTPIVRAGQQNGSKYGDIIIAVPSQWLRFSVFSVAAYMPSTDTHLSARGVADRAWLGQKGLHGLGGHPDHGLVHVRRAGILALIDCDGGACCGSHHS